MGSSPVLNSVFMAPVKISVLPEVFYSDLQCFMVIIALLSSTALE